MKANEIQIGDWVQDITPVVIDAISNEDICTYRAEYGYITANPSNLKPIPLTAEILVKNGFKKHNRYQYIHKDNYCKVCVSIAPRIEIDGMDLGEPPINVSIEGALFDINMNMSAIHELQHALRLCGINKEIVLNE